MNWKNNVFENKLAENVRCKELEITRKIK